MKKPYIAVIIVNFNGQKFLKNCLDSVFKQNFYNYEVFVIDNGSSDSSKTFIKKNYPLVKLIVLDRNHGFTGGNNIGIKLALENSDIKFIVCLNNDTIVDRFWLQGLVNAVKENKNTGIVNSKVFLLNTKLHVIGLSLERGLQSYDEGGISIGYNMNSNEFNKEKDIFAPHGVSFIIKREVLNDIGFFDEDFFAYVEDLDLGFRAKLAGWKCLYTPQSKLIHLHSMTGGIASPFKTFYLERNTILTAIKNLPLKLLFLFFINNMTVKFSSLNKKSRPIHSLTNKIGIFRTIVLLFKIYSSVLYLLPKFLIKRHKIQKHKVINDNEIKKWFIKYNRKNMELL